LTALLGVLAVGCSWGEIQKNVGFFHLNLLWSLGGVIGVFLAKSIRFQAKSMQKSMLPYYVNVINIKKITPHEDNVIQELGSNI
ncbi:hypothetical protein VXE44_23050, partial [Acinetobacter nosocomialis]